MPPKNQTHYSTNFTSSFFCTSPCKFPNHLCHLPDMPRANIPGSYYCKNITHIVLSHIQVPIHLASFQKGEPFQSQTTATHPGLWPFFPTAPSGFHRNRWVHWGINKMTRLLLKPLITIQVYSIWLVHQQKHKSGEQNKNLALEVCARDTSGSVSWEWEEECELCFGDYGIRGKEARKIPEQAGNQW